MDNPQTHHCGYVAIVGKPNAGKSTLMNALVGQKLSIVTPKPQTTRHRVLGILSDADYQMIFLDTPGVLQPKYGLHRSMMNAVNAATRDADVILMIVDATVGKLDVETLELIGARPVVLVVNKIDLVPPAETLPLVDSYRQRAEFASIVPISAKKRTQLDVLLAEIARLLPAGPALYPAEMISEQPERFFVSELIREAVRSGALRTHVNSAS